MPDGYLMMVLHAHLPFVRHPEDPHFLEERWLFEAITETYIPLLSRLEHLIRDGVRARLTMTWSPPLCEMLADPLLQSRYRLHVSRLLELAEQEVQAKQHSSFAEAARMYRDHYRYCLSIYERFQGNILSWVCQLRDLGVVEPITCGATHGFLPLMLTSEARRAQIAIAVKNYRKHFGCDPKGIWLPECGYVPGLEYLLKEQGIRFFFIDTHGVYFGTPRPRFGVYAPVFTEAGVAAFGRDPESSRSVWSAEVGYPGDSLYREFYRDLGYDGDYDYVKSFLHPDGVRRNLGLKYHAVTGKVQLHEKAPYLPTPAFARAMQHGADFVAKRVEQAHHLGQVIGRAPLIISPYDAELFGHWWFEGTQFIESIYRAAQNGGHQVLPVSGSEYLAEFPIHQVITPSASSWGDAGYNGVWLNPSNDWIYRHLHAAEERMVALAQRFPNADGYLLRALNQMARELLLAQSSDWAFIMTSATTVPYAVRRTHDHINRFMRLHEQIISNQIQEDSVRDIEWRDSAFQEMDYRIYAGPRH